MEYGLSVQLATSFGETVETTAARISTHRYLQLLPSPSNSWISDQHLATISEHEGLQLISLTPNTGDRHLSDPLHGNPIAVIVLAPVGYGGSQDATQLYTTDLNGDDPQPLLTIHTTTGTTLTPHLVAFGATPSGLSGS